MRYHLDTIPVWDAAKLDGECLLCALNRQLELRQIEYALGASVMEPDVRIQVNEKGFCRYHQQMLFKGDNRLGHALMLDSHLTESRKKIKDAFTKITDAANGSAKTSLLGRLSGKSTSPEKELDQALDSLSAMTETCIVCDAIEDRMNRFLHTFFHLYQHDSEFRKHFEQSKGVCLPHAVDLLRFAKTELNAKDYAAFASLLARLEEESFDRMQEDISWFIKKFDYRFQAEPWKNSRDAVERSINKLRGWCVGKEPNPDNK